MTLEVITGCMFAGKSTHLIEKIHQALQQEKYIEAYFPEIDDRYSDSKIDTHGDVSWSAQAIPTTSEGITTLMNSTADVIVIDEANFLTKDFVDPICSIAEDSHVIVAGLNKNFRDEPFVPVPTLMEHAEITSVHNAICSKCGSPANHTQRLIDGEPAPPDAPEIVVGGSETYTARCDDCYEI